MYYERFKPFSKVERFFEMQFESVLNVFQRECFEHALNFAESLEN